MKSPDILVVGGYGEVGRRLTEQLDAIAAGRIIVGGRHPDAAPGMRSVRVDVEDPKSIECSLEGVGLVVACVRQRQPHLLRAAVRRGVAYTSIAPPWIPWPQTVALGDEAERTGARVVLAAGLEPGISSLLVRAAVEKLGGVDAVESALGVGVGDTVGADSLAGRLVEVAQ
jgi:saccharopine dehydrogenase (NAD+, L-lysine forming)